MSEVKRGKQFDRVTKTTWSHVWTEDRPHFLLRLPLVCGSRGRLLGSLGTQKQKAAAFSGDARELLKERKLKSFCWEIKENNRQLWLSEGVRLYDFKRQRKGCQRCRLAIKGSATNE